MPLPSEHSCRLEPPGKYDRFARKNDEQRHDGKPIDVIYGIIGTESEIQALRYPKDKWTPAEASAHCKTREGTFEAAGEEKKDLNMDTPKRGNCETCGKAIVHKSMTMETMPPLAVPEAEGSGCIEGYAAVFGNVDSQGEVIRKGAFTKTIRERVPSGKVKLMVEHLSNGGRTMDCIGTITEAREDDKGLWIHAELSSDQTAQDARAKAREGHVTGLSIGYQVLDKAETTINGEIVMELKEIKWLEVTLTPFPANELAEVTSAKSEIVAPEPQPTPAPVRAVTVDWKSIARRRRIALDRAQHEDCEHG